MPMRSVNLGTKVPASRSEETKPVSDNVRDSGDAGVSASVDIDPDAGNPVVDMTGTDVPVLDGVSVSEREAWKARDHEVKEDVVPKAPRVRGKPAGKRQSKQVEAAGVSVIRGIPKKVVSIMRREFLSEDMNLLDLFMVYTYCHASASDRIEIQSCMTEHQLSLVSGYRGSETEAVQNKLDRILSRLSAMERASVTVEMLSGFVAFDRLGFRNGNPGIPSDVDFMEDGMTDLMEVARRQSASYKKRMGYIEGTPIK